LSWVDGAWRDRLVGTANGGAIRLVALEQELTLVGAFVETTTAVIADRMMVLAVAPGRHKRSQAPPPIRSGATAFYAATPIRITAAGGTFTGGKVRLVLHAMSFTAPAG
jgi:hypothetical protein